LIRITFTFLITFSGCWLRAQNQEAALEALKQRLDDAVKNPEAWSARQNEIRQKILVSTGLWPEFERPPLHAKLFHRLKRDGYSVEKVRIETWPGVCLTGNLYRPRGKKGPFPAVLSPHGHWKAGRFADEASGSVPGRCITLARLGFVVFSYDMVGYGDFKRLPHRKFTEDHSWGLDLTGLQLWNSLRALDFLADVKDVDPHRIGVTGASGGATQAFLLTAVDDRISVSAPVNMTAFEFQGGCSCENAPLLRIDLNNVEITAMTAPRPLLIISCTGDWTKNTLTLEGPLIKKVYEALGVPDRMKFVQFDAKHNYNKDSREAMYSWMSRWLKGEAQPDKISEPPFRVEQYKDLAVYPRKDQPPKDALNLESFKLFFQKKVRSQLENLAPSDSSTLKHFRMVMKPALHHIFTPRISDKKSFDFPHRNAGKPAQNAILIVGTSKNEAERLRSKLFSPGDRAFIRILESHERENASGGTEKQWGRYPKTFYRTTLSHQVSDILTDIFYIDAVASITNMRLVGLGDAGLPVLLSRALTKSHKITLTIADLNKVEEDVDHPYMRRIDAVRTAAMLIAPYQLILNHVPENFSTEAIERTYAAAAAPSALKISHSRWSLEDILKTLR